VTVQGALGLQPKEGNVQGNSVGLAGVNFERITGNAG
jgi:hypothetical protein